MTWTLPEPFLIERSDPSYTNANRAEVDRVGFLLTEKLDELKARCEVDRVVIGPQITRYEMTPAQGVSMRAIPRHAADLAYEIAAESVRIIAPIPGRRAVGIEVPTAHRHVVRLGDVMSVARPPLCFPIGLNADGETVGCNLAAMPHLLIAGQTGSGKSTLVNTALVSLLAQATPDQLALVLVDPKMVELTPYEGVPHLMAPIADSPSKALDALMALVDEMEYRYELAASLGARSLDELNDRLPERHRMPRILCVVDELADLVMMARREVETAVVRIAQKARAVGIHLILATQTPRVTVVTGIIKANMPARVTFSVPSATDSRVVLDRNGAEKLLGAGDMLYLPPVASVPIRVQGAYVSTEEIRAICDHWRAQGSPRVAPPRDPEIDVEEWIESIDSSADRDLIRKGIKAGGLHPLNLIGGTS